MDYQEYRRWTRHARKGDRVVYHTGRTCHTLDGDKLQVAMVVLADYGTGVVDMTQRKVAGGIFEYIAVRL